MARPKRIFTDKEKKLIVALYQDMMSSPPGKEPVEGLLAYLIAPNLSFGILCICRFSSLIKRS